MHVFSANHHIMCNRRNIYLDKLREEGPKEHDDDDPI